MADTFIPTSSNTPTLLFDNQYYILAEGATHYNEDTVVTAVNEASNTDIAVYGNMFSADADGIFVTSSSSHEIVIGVNGSIYADGKAIFLAEDTLNSFIVNQGSLTGTVGVRSDGTGGVLQNQGLISGTITAGVEAFGDGFNVLNSGIISGGGSAAVRATDPNFRIENTGTITSQSLAIYTTAGLSLDNSGTITTGHGTAIEARTGVNTIVNSGLILGDIQLSDEADFYDGRTGQVTGRIIGGFGNDTIYGGDNDDVILAQSGSDTVYGGGGNDTIIGLSGSDRLFGGDGDDELSASQPAVIEGGAGNDLITLQSLGSASTADGGTGEDTLVSTYFGVFGDIDMQNGLFGLTIADNFEHMDLQNYDVGTMTATNDDNTITLRSVETLRTYDGSDIITVSGKADRIFSGAGNDIIEVGESPLVNAGSGEDRVTGGLKADVIFGGSGDDVILASNGEDKLRGNDGDDLLHGEVGNDDLQGQNGNDTLSGGVGNDSLFGGAGDDDLTGDDGDDLLYGDAGADYLFGGLGDDRLRGGADADIFVFNADSDFERVLDWQDGIDLIDLSGFNFTDANQALSNFFQQGSNVRIINGTGDVMVISDAVLAEFTAADLIL